MLRADTSSKAHAPLLVTFVVVWLALGGHALRDEPLSLWGVTLEQPEIFIAFPRTPPQNVEQGETPSPEPPVIAPTAEARPSPAAGPTRPARASEAQRILIFGDSMIDELMLRLADYAAHNGHTLFPAIWYGASTVSWSQGGRLTELLRQHDPTFVIAVIGSAELTTRRLEARRVAVRRILHELEGRKMIWVGPPSWTADTGIDDLLAESVGAGRYFRSSTLFRERADQLPRKRDGIHPTREASSAWMDAVTRWIETESSVPIRLDAPARPAPRPVAQVFPPPTR